MIKKGFNLFKSNCEIVSTEGLESVPEIEIPPEFLLFVSMFKLGTNEFLNAKRNFEGFIMPITNVEYSNVRLNHNLCLSHFYELSELEERWLEDVVHSVLYHEHGLLPVAYNEANLDHIYINVRGEGGIFYADADGVVELEESIFDFCKKIFETEILDEDFKKKNVYKVWGDNYWQCE